MRHFSNNQLSSQRWCMKKSLNVIAIIYNDVLTIRTMVNSTCYVHNNTFQPELY